MSKSLAEQVVYGSGASTHRLDEHMRVPASVMLAQGNVPMVGERGPSELLGVRPLSEVEAQTIAMEAVGVKTRQAYNLTDRIRVRHHAVARLFATGHKKSEISRIMKISAVTLNQLERSPAFQALVLEYMNMMDKEGIESHTRMKVLGNLGMDELTRRLSETPETLKTGDVLSIVQTAADRTGMGPTSKQVTLNGRISPRDLRAIKTAEVTLEAEYSVVDQDGRDSADAELDSGDEAFADAEGGEEARADDGQVAIATDDFSDLITDLGEILGSTRGGVR